MYRRILVAVENSPADRTILDARAELAALTGAELLLVHVADGWAARNFDELKLRESEEMKADRAYLDAARRGAAAQASRSSTELAMGDPGDRADSRCAEEREVDLHRDVHARPPLPQRSGPRHHRQPRSAPGQDSGPAAPRTIIVRVVRSLGPFGLFNESPLRDLDSRRQAAIRPRGCSRRSPIATTSSPCSCRTARIANGRTV